MHIMQYRLIVPLLFLSVGCSSAGSVKTSIRSVETPSAPLRVVDMGGAVHDLDAARAQGKSVALIFWQTWCGSCRREAPEIVSAARKYGDSIEFLGVVPGPEDAVDDAEVLRVAAEWGLTYPQVRDTDLNLTRRFEVRGTPTIIVLGPSGDIVYRGNLPPPNWLVRQ